MELIDFRPFAWWFCFFYWIWILQRSSWYPFQPSNSKNVTSKNGPVRSQRVNYHPDIIWESPKLSYSNANRYHLCQDLKVNVTSDILNLSRFKMLTIYIKLTKIYMPSGYAHFFFGNPGDIANVWWICRRFGHEFSRSPLLVHQLTARHGFRSMTF